MVFQTKINHTHLVPYIQRIDHKKYLFSNPLTHGNFLTLHIVMHVHNTCSYEQNKLPQVQPVFLRPELITHSQLSFGELSVIRYFRSHLTPDEISWQLPIHYISAMNATFNPFNSSYQ